MASLIQEFNEIIENCIDVCISQGERIDCTEASYQLTAGKVTAIFNLLMKEIQHNKDCGNFKKTLVRIAGKYCLFFSRRTWKIA